MHTRSPLPYLFLFAAALALGGCRSSKANFGSTDTGTGGGTLTCTEQADCMGTGVCRNGICESVTPCQDDSECQTGVCHSTRGFCVQCDGRHAGECAPGETCQFDFTCVAIGGGGADAGTPDGGSVCSGMCGTRDDCAPDRVCRGAECCPPPPRCSTIEDCPVGRPECNGATGMCFGGDSCNDDNDCATRPGCSGMACRCDQPAPGQPGVCRMRDNECQNDMDCWENGAYAGKFCTLNVSPTQCVPAPPCPDDIECGNAGLVCDLQMGSPSNGRCVNGPACPNGNECAATQLCDNGVCVGANCVNSPAMCTGNQVCNQQTGRCDNQGGMQCTMNSDCGPGTYCNLSVNMCLPGCRDSSDCPNGICNASNQCESGAGMLCGPCNTDADCPAGTECYESPLTMMKTCREPCNMFTGQDCMIDPSATCLFIRCTCGF